MNGLYLQRRWDDGYFLRKEGKQGADMFEVVIFPSMVNIMLEWEWGLVLC